LLVTAARRLAPLHGAGPGDYAWLPACRAGLRAMRPGPTPVGVPDAPAAPPSWLPAAGVAAVVIGLAVIGWPLWSEWRGTVASMPDDTGPPAAAARPPPVEDAEAPPLAAADLQLLVDAGDDHALLDDLEFFVWLAERTPDAD
jgi:hypothetical protein